MVNAQLWPVHSFVDGLVAGGVRDVVLSPGSRNTPLTMAFVEHPDVFVYTHMDERSAGFFALGLAKGSRRPVVIACTSGTAAANYYPAVMEAYEARVPLMVITADRPPLLRDVGANQAVRQTYLYASHVKWSIEMPIPDGDVKTAQHAASVAARACGTAVSSPVGPVHINYPFVEPLMPTTRDAVDALTDVKVPVIHGARSVPDSPTIHLLDASFAEARRPLVVVGPSDDVHQLDAVWHFALENQIPVMIDGVGHLRSRTTDQTEHVLTHYDTLLRSGIEHLPLEMPDWILRFGAEPTSKALSGFLSRLPRRTRILIVDGSPMYRDASFCATDVIVGNIESWLTSISRRPSAEHKAYALAWSAANQVARLAVEEHVHKEWSEASLIYHLTMWMSEHSQLMIGNSRPVRDLDTVLGAPPHAFATFANRGTSGIDGVVSTAFGLAASRPDKRTVLCIGDVSFYHDLNGLLASRRFAIPLTIVLIHNQGGGIFQHLSQTERPDTLPYFTTPHEIDFQPIVESYGGMYTRAYQEVECQQAFAKSMQVDGLHVIEVRFENASGAQWHRTLMEMVRRQLEDKL